MKKPNKKLLSELFPPIYWLRVWQKRICRLLYWSLHRRRYNLIRGEELLPHRHTKHNSKLIRLHGDDQQHLLWQTNKVINLQLAIPKINRILIAPGQTFSFCKVVGRPTRRKGYVEGMELSRGQPRSGIGGGLCQISNLLNWMAWHTPLRIVQRSLHSFDPFPDNNRVLPFGSGAAVFWNYVDLQISNPTEHTFQLVLRIEGNMLKGEIRCSVPASQKFSVFERNHFFTQGDDGQWYRSNEIWRRVNARGGGRGWKTECDSAIMAGDVGRRDGGCEEGEVAEMAKFNNSNQVLKREREEGEELLVRNWSKVCYVPDVSKYDVR